MFMQILVPLDGSQRAEQAIPFAAQLARASGGLLFFVRVVDTPREIGATSPLAVASLQEMLEQEQTEAAAYLEDVTASSGLKGLKTRCAVFAGPADSVLLHVARQEGIDLVVICSHGHTGLKRWALGSIARTILRQSTLPLLLLREQHVGLQDRLGQSICAQVALDGSPLAATALLPAGHLVAALSAPCCGALHLVRVVQRPADEKERTKHAAAIARAEQYLQTTRAMCLSALPGIQVTWAVVQADDVAEALVCLTTARGHTPEQHADDLIALTTHGRGGLQRWRLGSVSERVLRASTLPLLIVHPQGVPSGDNVGRSAARAF